MEARTKTTNIDSTAVLSDLTQGKIPVGVEGGNWNHITPIALAEKIQQNIEESFAENLTETITNNLKETVSTEIADIRKRIEGGEKQELIVESGGSATYTRAISAKSGDEIIFSCEGYFIRTVVDYTREVYLLENLRSQRVSLVIEQDADVFVVLEPIPNFNGTRVVYGQIGRSLTDEMEDQTSKLSDAIDKLASKLDALEAAGGTQINNVKSQSVTVNLGAYPKPTLYKCDTVNRLLIYGTQNIHEVTIIFTSGANPTEITIPASALIAGTINVEANKTYVLSILHGIFVCKALNS